MKELHNFVYKNPSPHITSHKAYQNRFQLAPTLIHPSSMASSSISTMILGLVVLTIMSATTYTLVEGARNLQESTVSETQVPQLPKPELPPLPKVAELPKPELPKIPEFPKPELPKVPELPKGEVPELKVPEMHI
ncbi:hypothetical protein VNO77_05218 [Canavalia gladiata]|uniref:Uncharacterized protein n=1 Tax=Canavalia gladiata TaxID=3824 RepID=A0AAN9MXY6_CANGL